MSKLACRVLRGGSLGRDSWVLRTSFRIRYVPVVRYGLDGFRLVVVRRSP